MHDNVMTFVKVCARDSAIFECLGYLKAIFISRLLFDRSDSLEPCSAVDI